MSGGHKDDIQGKGGEERGVGTASLRLRGRRRHNNIVGGNSLSHPFKYSIEGIVAGTRSCDVHKKGYLKSGKQGETS